MPWYSEFSSFLLRWAAESGLVLVAASAAVILLRQPATRLRIIQWSFVACLLLAGLHRLDLGPRWSLSFPDRSRIRENSGRDALPPPDLSQSRLSLRESASFRGAKGDNARSRIRENSGDVPPRPDFSRSRLRAVTNGPLDPRALVVAGYLAGVAVMAGWWLAGWVAVRRLLRRSRPADKRCHAILREIAGRRAARVRLVECPTAAQPLVSGWWRPVIVVPTGLASGDALALRCALAHEWSHVARGDIAWWSLAGVVRVVCFYQPPVWWLRGRMRLAQDCLADAEAAAQAPSAEDYAELLTRWATNRLPLLARVSTASLGILGRKSDLYRRIVMLVQHRVDRRCPRRWEMAIAISAVALLVSAATYGGAEDPPRGQRATPEKPIVHKDEVKRREPAPPAARSAEQVRLDRLVDGVLTRARAIHSGRFQFRRTVDRAVWGLFDDAREADFRISLSGDDWAVSQMVVFNNIGRNDVIMRRAGRLLMLRCARSPQERAELRIENPNSVPRGDLLAAIRAGTLPNEAVGRFIDEHRHEAQLSAGKDAEEIGRTTRMEWKVAADDTARVFGHTGDLLAGGGLLRIDVAEENGYVLPLVEYVDRFGGVEARFLAARFVDVAPGVLFPELYQVSHEAETHYAFHGIELVNKPVPDEDFELNTIPAGTHVTDFRPRRGPDGKRLTGKPGPLQNFTLGAVYGLPKEMLAAMDEGVLSEEEAKRMTEAGANPPGAPAPQPAEQPAEPQAGEAPAAGKRNDDLRYAGRSFQEWRQQLLNDLDPSTCTQAMPPIAAFGKMGYTDEAVAALAEVLRSERATEGPDVAGEAAKALVKIGAPAVPVLIEGLADPRPRIRAACAKVVSQLGETGRATGDALSKLLDDKEMNVRWAAATSLVAVGDDDVLRRALERLAVGDHAGVLVPFLIALNQHPPEGDWWVGPCLRLANDEDPGVRSAVGAMLASHGPPEKRVIRAVEKLMRDDDLTVAQPALVALSQGDANNVPLLIAVLSDTIKSAESPTPFSDGLGLLIARLGSAPQHAAASVPLLAAMAEAPSQTDDPLLAMDALGKLGPAAKGAIPALERWLARVDVPADAPHKKHARRALQKIRAEDGPGDGE